MRAALAAGDLEGAISALERLAIFAPELGRIKFELGVLYLRLAAYDIAKADFEAADAAADATPEMKASIAGYLASIDRQAAGDRLTGALMVGARATRPMPMAAPTAASSTLAARSSC